MRTQNIVFTLLMVVFMVATMEFYNQGLMDGRLSWAAMGRAIHEMVFMMPQLINFEKYPIDNSTSM